MSKLYSASWLIHIFRIFATAVLSFVLHQSPYLFSSKPYSIGADGDSAFHFAIQMKLHDSVLFPKDIELNEMYLSSRPAFEFTIHRTVIWLADHLSSGNLFFANIVLFWSYNLLFLAGCYFLGLFVLRSPGGAVLFAAASVGLSKAFNAWWGMAYGAVIPKYVGLTLIPWFLLGYLWWFQHPRWLVALFFALGLFVNVYPLLPLYLALILLAVTFSRPRLPLVLCLVMGIAFFVAALPSVFVSAIGTFEKIGMLNAKDQAILETLHMRYYSYALLNLKYTAVSLISPIWFILVIAGVGLLLKRRGADLNETETQLFLRLGVWIVVLGLLGLIAGLVNRLQFTVVHTFLVFVCIAWVILQATRAGLLVKWFKIDLSGVEGQLFLFTVWTMALSLAGFFVGTIYRPLLTFLFHRASALLYIPAYLGCSWLALHWIRHRTVIGLTFGTGIVLLMLLNGAINTALFCAIRGVPTPQTSGPYYALADWAAQNTTSASLFMVPYGSRTETFFAFRVYSARGVLLHWATGEIAISNPSIASTFWQMSNDIEPLYKQASDTTDFVRVAHKYGVEYIITDQATPCLPDLPIAYQNEPYTVFIVPPK